MLSGRVVCVDHGDRGRGGNHSAKVGLSMISVVVVAVVVVAFVVVAVVAVSSVVFADVAVFFVVVAVVMVAFVVVAVVVVSTVLLFALVAAAPVVFVAVSLSTVASLLVATVAAAVVLLLLTAVRIVVSRRSVESAPVAVLVAGSVSRRRIILLETISFLVTFLFAKGTKFRSRCRHRKGAALRCARGPTFLFYAICVHVAQDDHSFFKIDIMLGFGSVLDSIVEWWKLTQNDFQNVIIIDGLPRSASSFLLSSRQRKRTSGSSSSSIVIARNFLTKTFFRTGVWFWYFAPRPRHAAIPLDRIPGFSRNLLTKVRGAPVVAVWRKSARNVLSRCQSRMSSRLLMLLSSVHRIEEETSTGIEAVAVVVVAVAGPVYQMTVSG